ncbi:MAG: phytanoyl-CoA dioxygenase family protein [Armatimonadetes bacterium]|nr:phytanoyl-CoA dioxygenase family protein [Armatimonadota bacterium]
MSGFAEQFDRDGFALAKSVFGGELLDAMAADFDRIVRQLEESGEEINARWAGTDEDSVLIHTHNVQQYSAVWMRALLHEPFLDCARALLGPDIVLHHTKLFSKPPEKGAPIPMHQDWAYFPCEKDTMIAAVIHLSEATDEMGCLRVVAGSHKMGRMPDSGGQSADFAVRYPIEDSVALEASPGDVAFFHYFTVHGSKPNISDRTRKTVLVQMHSGDDVVEDGCQHPDEHLVLSGWNRRMTRDLANRT